MEDNKAVDTLAELLEQAEDFEGFKEPLIPMNLENVEASQYDRDKFLKGIKDVSYLAGQITGLQNVGLSEDGVLALIAMLLEKELLPTTMKHNLELAKTQTTNFEKATI